MNYLRNEYLMSNFDERHVWDLNFGLHDGVIFIALIIK